MLHRAAVSQDATGDGRPDRPIRARFGTCLAAARSRFAMRADAKMTGSDRTGFVVFQLSVARTALRQGELRAARGALRVLRTTDFFGGAAVAESYFAVLRDLRSGEDELREAIAAIVNLRPVGLG
jgi:hypothetical protein